MAVFEALPHAAGWAETEQDTQEAAERAAADHGGANETQLHRFEAFLASANKCDDQAQGYSAQSNVEEHVGSRIVLSVEATT